MSQYWPWSPGWDFSTVNLLFSFLSMLSSLEGSLCVHLIFKEWGIVHPFLKGGVPILWNKWSGIVLYGRLIYSSVSIYLYSQLFISARTQGYSFILWVTLQYYFIYFVAQLFQLWPLGSLPLAPVTLWNTPTSVGFVFEHFLTLWHSQNTLSLFYISCPSPRIRCFSKELLFLKIGDWY